MTHENDPKETHDNPVDSTPGTVEPFAGIPLAVMKELRAIALEVNEEKRELSVAVADLDYPDLKEILSRHAPGMKIEIRQVPPGAIDRVIDRISSLGLETQQSRSESAPQSDTPVNAETESAPVTWDEDGFAMMEHAEAEEPEAQEHSQPPSNDLSRQVLIIAPDKVIASHVLFALQAENCSTRVVSSVSEACAVVSDGQFHAVFAHQQFRPEAEKLRRNIHSKQPEPELTFYGSDSSLVLNETEDVYLTELLSATLRLAQYLGSGRDALKSRRCGMTNMCHQLADSLPLSPHSRLSLLTAAHLYDIATRDLIDPDQYAAKDIVALSASRLEAWKFPARVNELLRALSEPDSPVAQDLSDQHRLAVCILRVAGKYSDSLPTEGPLTSRSVDFIRQELNGLRPTLSHPEVVDQALLLAQKALAASSNGEDEFHLHVLETESNLPEQTLDRLLESGMIVSRSDSVESCADLWAESRPHVMAICSAGSPEDQYEMLLSLALQGIKPDEIPTLLLLPDGAVWEAMGCLKYGIEDILPHSIKPDAILTKLLRIRERHLERSKVRQSILSDLGTHGSLKDMCLPDLLSGLRGNSKPAHLAVSARGKQLTAYIHRNSILYAECDGCTGIEALAQGLPWKDGIWSIDPIEPEQLPQPNLDKTIDSALLEACIECDTVEKV